MCVAWTACWRRRPAGTTQKGIGAATARVRYLNYYPELVACPSPRCSSRPNLHKNAAFAEPGKESLKAPLPAPEPCAAVHKVFFRELPTLSGRGALRWPRSWALETASARGSGRAITGMLQRFASLLQDRGRVSTRAVRSHISLQRRRASIHSQPGFARNSKDVQSACFRPLPLCQAAVATENAVPRFH